MYTYTTHEKKAFAKYLQSNAKKNALEARPFYGRESDAKNIEQIGN